MSKAFLRFSVFVLALCTSQRAFAALTSAPIAVGSVRVGSSNMAGGSLATTVAADHLDHYDLTAPGCASFGISPSSGDAVTGVPIAITVTFSPTARGSLDCLVKTFSDATTQNGTFHVTGTGVAPVATLAASTLDFGAVRVVGGTATRSLLVTNTGDAGQTLTIAQPVPASPEVTLTSPLGPQTLAMGQAVTFVFAFDPSTAGPFASSTSIASDDPVKPAQPLAFTGIGTNAVIAVAPLAFGTVLAGQTTTLPVVVTNTGAAPQGPLTLASAAIAGGSWFSFDNNGYACGGNTTCTLGGGVLVPPAYNLAVRCTPLATDMGTQTAMVTVTSNTDPGGVDTAMLTCTAGRPDIAVDKTMLAFGNQRVPTASAPQTFTVSNTGSAPLTISSISKSPNQTAYAIAPACAPCTIPIGGMTTFSVTFTPAAPGAVNTQILIASNSPDPGDSPATIDVTGTGIAPQITAPLAVAFNPVELGATDTQVVNVSNSGTDTLTITSATITALPSDFTITAAGTTTLAIGASTTWTIRCNPQAPPGLRTGTFEIKSDSFTRATADVSLMCTGNAGVLAVATTPPTVPPKLTFPGTAINTTRTLSFTLENTGTLDVTNVMATVSPTTVSYSIDPATPVPASILAGASVTLSILFAPVATTDGGPASIVFAGTWGTGATATTATLLLSGTALSADLNVSTATVDFGSFEYDTTPTQTFCLINSSQSAVTVTTVMINVTGSTATTELVVTGIKKQATCGTGGVAQGLPYATQPGETLEVSIRAQPANRTGALTADAVVTTTLGVNPTRHVALMGTATSGLLSVAPGMTIDFGSVDVDTGPVTKTITLRNTGDGNVTLSAFAKSNAKFAVALPGATTLMPNQTLDLVVTYDPSVMAADSMTITHAIAHSLTQLSQTITITGVGTDRVMSIPAMQVAFPDTFRNPGTKAPTMPVDVGNTGTAPLHISAAMVDVAGVWALADVAPIVVMPGETHHFMVTFTPTMAGKAPDGQLVLTTDAGDGATVTKIAMIALTGNGLDRRVMLGPQPIDVGFTGVGTPIVLADILTVTSMDDAITFQIRALQLDDSSAFALEDAPINVPLPPATTQAFSLTFTPATEGNFTATASLYLDEDPQAQNTVTITGHAATLDIHGSGGCATGGGGGGFAMVIVVLGIALRRRAALVLILVPIAARADDVDLTVFAPTPQTARDAIHVQSANVGKPGDFAIDTVVSYASNPLVIESLQGGLRIGDDRAVKVRTLFDLGVAFAFLGRFEAGVRMPIYQQSGETFDPKMTAGIPAASGTARGDLAVNAKVRLAHSPGFAFGLGIAGTAPTATKGQLTGSTKPEGRALLLGTYTGARLTINANAGANLRATTTYLYVQQRSDFAWGVGASFRITDEIWAIGEAFGEVAPKAGAGMTTIAPTEGLVGGSFHLGTVALELALGRGLTNSVGAPDLRGVLSLSYAPGTPQLASLHRPALRGVDGDRDGDGIPDSIDKCPDEPEDKDMFDDDDGCPDPDNDGDGIPDVKDKCPLDPEDKDGFQDEDGCPDPDNDNDGIPDAQDKCPNVPEDKDGFQDLDGCPDPDNDGDGIPDVKDKCPNEPETINGVQDEDGCPDQGDSAVVLSPDRIETLEPISFGKGTVIAKSSTNVLSQIGALLRAHAEIVRIRITVHVQPTSDADKDQALSDKRAQAVKDWLVKFGIAEKRLEPRGFGGTRPLVPARQKGAAQINDRIEIVIMERK